MTLQTRPSAAASAGRSKTVLNSTALFWSLVTMIVALTVTLTGWTAAQARVVDDAISGNGPQYPSIRQLERQAEDNATQVQHPSIRQVERQAERDLPEPPPVSVRQGERMAQQGAEPLAQMEAAEVARFRNRVAVTDSIEFAGVTDEDLMRLERQELHRFRNRAPAEARVALDAEIRRLSAAIA